MQKLVVIDDEIGQCRSMKKIMEKLFPQISVEIFTDPACAIAYIEEESVHIVITDICMPEIDGLTLVQRLMESDRSRKIVLLTGYAEFEYARRAVSLGAYDFLLKPMNPDKLKAVIEKCLTEVQEELQSRQEYRQMHQRLDAAWPVYMENLMNQWLEGILVGEEQEKIHKIFPENKQGFLMLTRFFGFDSMKEMYGNEEICRLKNSLGLRMRERLGKSYHSLSFFVSSRPETMATLVFPKHSGQSYPAWVKNPMFWESFFPEFARGERKIQVGVGLYVENLEEEKKVAYEGAEEALEYAFYIPESGICLRKEIVHELKKRVEIDNVQEKRLFEALKYGKEEDAFKYMEEILEACMLEDYPAPGELVAEISRLLGRVASSLLYPKNFSGLGEEMGYPSYDGFRQKVYDYLKEFCQKMRLRDEGGKNSFVRKFQDFMKDHYMEDISLEDVASQFMLSPAYCSRLIKDTVGSNFTQILLEERMKEARELLTNTDMHIYEVAGSVGYDDVKYFNRVFKASIGMTPRQFRRESTGGKRQ